jgi:hypothetical protein
MILQRPATVKMQAKDSSANDHASEYARVWAAYSTNKGRAAASNPAASAPRIPAVRFPSQAMLAAAMLPNII